MRYLVGKLSVPSMMMSYPDEAIFMANRVVVFSARPGRIKNELAIDLLLAASREDQAGVVRVWASGTADPALGNVLFFYQGAGMPLQLDPAGGRWTTGLDLGSDVLAAVNIVVVVAQGTEGVSVAKAMGMP